MAGTISSLGIGSSVLTSDVIDKLKANDTANMVTPIDNKITLQAQKGQALSLLSSLLDSFKSNIANLSDSTMYQKRSVSGSNDGVSVTALSGSDVQSFSISSVVLAKKDVVQSGSFTSTTSPIATGNGTLNIQLGTSSYAIDYTAETTLDDLRASIANATGGSITASSLQTGSSAYSLVLTSNNTGQDQAITLSNTGNLLGQLDTGMQTIQSASDASFTYNGISITRSTNTINDLQSGVTINLLKDAASSNISISQDKQAIADELKIMTTSYNTLTKQLDDMTLADTENGKVGIFNGDNTIKAIKRDVTRMMTSMDPQGQSLAQYGIGLDQDGTMTFTQSDFDIKMNASPTGLEAFFSGSTSASGEYTEGIFGNLDTLLNSYTGTSGLMSTLTDASKNETTTLTAEKKRANDLLTARYDTMTARFAAYDSIISQLNNQFASLQQQINAMSNSS